jgi:ParB family transcriptional regulator, chromosome partitioning protein
MQNETPQTNITTNTQNVMPAIKNNKIYFLHVDSIFPNPYQPRKEFDSHALADLADSITQYGILQPLTVTEAGTLPDGRNKYELIAGERRLRASKIAGITSVPCVIRIGDDDKNRFELAIIENLQREDLNPIDRAIAFERLAREFNLSHGQIGQKMGKSREYVSNSMRLLNLPEYIKQALIEKKILEGHTRPLMMLSDKAAEQQVLFKEIMYKHLSVRESESIARRIAIEKVRKDSLKIDPKVRDFEEKFSKELGTRVQIEKKQKGSGGKIVIDFFTEEDLTDILYVLSQKQTQQDAFNSNSHLSLDIDSEFTNTNIRREIPVHPKQESLLERYEKKLLEKKKEQELEQELEQKKEKESVTPKEKAYNSIFKKKAPQDFVV